MNADLVRPLLKLSYLFLFMFLIFTIPIQNCFGFEREPAEEKKPSTQQEINYEDPNLAMTNSYVTENVVLCTDENDLASDSQEKCHPATNAINPSTARVAPINPVISDTLYLVDVVNSRRFIFTHPPAIVPAPLTDKENDKRK